MRYKGFLRAVALILASAFVLCLVGCGAQGDSTPQQDNNDYVQQTPANATTNKPAASQTSSGWYGLWDGGSAILEINENNAYYYVLGSVGDDPFEERIYVECYDCSYTISNNVMDLTTYDLNGGVMFSSELTLSGNYLCIEGEPEAIRITGNSGPYGDVIGCWNAIGPVVRMEGDWFSSISGDELTFYSDGTCLLRWKDGAGTYDCTYNLTSKYDNPAIGFRFNGYDADVLQYEFISNDLMMIYTNNDRTCGFLLYREN